MDGVATGTVGGALVRADRLARAVLAHAGVLAFGGALSVAIAVPGLPPVRAAAFEPRAGDVAAQLLEAPILPSAASNPPLAPPAILLEGPGDPVVASWYGPGFYGNRLPCWRWLQARELPIALEPTTWGVAHKTLPCGTPVTLSYGGRSVVVPVVDRGPYVAGRMLDLTIAVKAALGCPDLCTLLMHLGD